MDKINIKKIAKKLNKTPAYITQILHGSKRCGASMAMHLGRLTNGLVDPAALRPDIFAAMEKKRKKGV